MQNKGGYSDHRQYVTHIDFVIHSNKSTSRSWTGGSPLHATRPAPVFLIASKTRRDPLHRQSLSPVCFNLFQPGGKLASRSTALIIWCPRRAGKRSVKNQCRHTVWICSREEDIHRTTLGNTQKGCPLQANCIHNCAHIIHPLLKRR